MIACKEDVWLRHIKVIKQYAEAETKAAQKKWGGPNALATNRAEAQENGRLGGRPSRPKPRTKRVALVVEMLNEGFTVRVIGEAVGISHQAVISIKRRYID